MDALTSAAPVEPGSAEGLLRLGAPARPAPASAAPRRRSDIQTDTVTGAAKPAHLSIAADIEAAMRERGDARRRQEAADETRRRESERTAKAAHTSHMLSVPRMAGLMTAGALLGSAAALAEALSIQPRSLRAKTGAERGVSCDDLRSAANALDARAALLIEHAAKLRAEIHD